MKATTNYVRTSALSIVFRLEYPNNYKKRKTYPHTQVPFTARVKDGCSEEKRAFTRAYTVRRPDDEALTRTKLPDKLENATYT